MPYLFEPKFKNGNPYGENEGDPRNFDSLGMPFLLSPDNAVNTQNVQIIDRCRREGTSIPGGLLNPLTVTGRGAMPSVFSSGQGNYYVSSAIRDAIEGGAPNCAAFTEVLVDAEARGEGLLRYYFLVVKARACKINWRASATKKMTYRTLSGQSVARLPDTSAGPAKLIITNHLADASPHLWIEGEVSIDGVTYQQYDTHIYINDALFDEIQHLSRGCLADAKLGQST